ncbi:Predicted arabinose efflux permease, MFS family [Alteribacillus persepolensis]|uniref:Predicted arabinose efflux permease, MFS family n=1 Tax=Alteribacillus persepolensis TaxID=568899 RepID=A0A1G8GU34_9BACI|nr:MFS transporter [Alteribacillus persepolensis]SDH97862.1 Predicted arabinose efflux permease, MFS family [Alteribacillus persepolensis]
MEKEQLWTKDFIITSVVNFFMMFAVFLLLVTMAPYATETFQASSSIAGLSASIFIIGVLCGRLFAGRAITKTGNKKILMFGLVLYIVTTLLYFAAISLPALIAVRVIHGIGVGLATTAASTMVAQMVPASRKGEGISFFTLSMVLPTAVGPLVAILLTQYVHYNAVFLLSLLLGVISLVISIQTRDVQPAVNTKDTAQQPFSLSNYFEKGSLPIALVAMVVGLAYSSVLSLLTVYAEAINLVTAATFFYLVYSITVLSTRPFSGRLTDKKGANIIIYPSLVFFAGGMLLLSQAQYSWMMLLAAFCIGLGYGNFQPITQTIAIKRTSSERMSLAISTYYVFLDFGLGIGPFLLGLLVPFTGYRGLYLTTVIIILFGAICYFWIHGRKDKTFHQRYAAETAS